MHLHDGVDCCKGYIGHFKDKTVCRWLTRFSRLQTVVLYFNREHKHIGVLFICGVGAGF